MLDTLFFNQTATELAPALLGKIIRHKIAGHWLACKIIETEAYLLEEKASHSSLGYTEKRKAMFMPAGTIYMYYCRGADSLNISAKGEGNAVLIKSAIAWVDEKSPENTLAIMQKLNPLPSGTIRAKEKLCSGQTLLCKSLDLKVKDWDQQQFDPQKFYIEDIGEKPSQIIQTRRLGIPEHRDAHLLYRYIDYDNAKHCTQNPLTKRNFEEGVDYILQK